MAHTQLGIISKAIDTIIELRQDRDILQNKLETARCERVATLLDKYAAIDAAKDAQNIAREALKTLKEQRIERIRLMSRVGELETAVNQAILYIKRNQPDYLWTVLNKAINDDQPEDFRAPRNSSNTSNAKP